ncbi:Uncharacterized protein Fot_30849 [Forsythia ovata]|uniref:Uncharacterized protein n=1 Tax=Forsythia ovata TaxID=205694 RepID=A0ABD1T3B5_9LAMI
MFQCLKHLGRKASLDVDFGVADSTEKKLKSRLAASDSEIGKNESKLIRRDGVESGRLFQDAVSSHDWGLSESLIFLADLKTLNDALHFFEFILVLEHTTRIVWNYGVD